jgi:hypothetical protein
MQAAPADWLQYQPMSLSPADLPDATLAMTTPLGRPIEDALDHVAGSKRRGIGRSLVGGYLATKTALRKYGPLLSEGYFHVARPDRYDEALGGVSNRMLLDAVGNVFDDLGAGDLEGCCVALALRLLQAGSPVVSTTFNHLDTHSEEDVLAPPMYTRIARCLAGIHFALTRMLDDEGVPLIDSTLVVTVSEFDRSPGSAETGFNDGLGSDHGGPFQPHLLFGAGIVPEAFAPTDDVGDPLDGKGHTTQALLATLCAALGIPAAEIDKYWPPGTALYPEGLPLWELWG